MYKKILLLVFSICLLTASFFLMTTRASAQQSPFNITTSPSSFDVKVSPGSTTPEKLRLRNNTDSPLTFTISLKKLTPDTNGQINLSDFKSEDSYKNWVSFTQASFSALPKEWTDLAFTITVPKEAAFGYYYAIFISPKPSSDKVTKPQAKLNGSLAIPILLYVSKDGAITDGHLLSFSATQGFSEYPPINFVTSFENKGNIHVKPKGNIFIKDWTGTTVDTIDINKSGGSILPSSQRKFTSTWDNSFITLDPKMEDGKILTDSKGNPQTQLRLHFDRILNFRIGEYTAHALVIVSGEKHDVSYELSTSFWIFPWKIIGGFLIVILLAGIGLVNTGKSIFSGIRKVLRK